LLQRLITELQHDTDTTWSAYSTLSFIEAITACMYRKRKLFSVSDFQTAFFFVVYASKQNI